MSDDDLVADYLAVALERLDHGTSVDLDGLCAARPDLRPAVAAALRLREGLVELREAATQHEPAIGRVLQGRYRLVAALGRGAAGAVYQAHDQRLDRDVAVKLLHAGATASPEALARFRREAEVLAHHAHPHVVRVYDQGQDADGTPFLVTELLEGHSLHAVLEASRAAMPDGPSATSFVATGWLQQLLPAARGETSYLRQVVSWAVQLGDGLAAAHARGVVHRDVKPSNVFVCIDGTAVLLDFGIAARAGDPALTLPSAIVGTPCYMAPEQARGCGEPTLAVDVYGLTATLYHLLTLRPPHAGDLQEVLTAVRTGEPVPAALLHTGLPRDLQAILDHGLERDPKRRYASAAELSADLQAFLDHRQVSVRPIGALRRGWRAARRHPARASAAVFAVLAAALLLLVLPLWVVVLETSLAAEAEALWAKLPADLCIEGQPDERLLVPLAERSVVLAELDRLLAIDAADPMARLLRAAERLDAGDPAAAHADFTALRERTDSPYLAAVAERYAAAVVVGRLGRVDTDDLPAPMSPTDCFVAGFHAMRRHDFPAAWDLLGRCGGLLPARDLRLLAACGRPQPDAEALLTEAAWLEGHYGRPTARTRHAMTVAMLLLRRYETAITYAEESLRLRPDRHGPWNNLALAHLRSGNLEEAERCYRRAVELRPWFANSLSGLAQTLRQLGDHAMAANTAGQIRDESWREHELGNLAVAMAVTVGASGDHPARRHHAAAAAEHFRKAAAVPVARTRNPRHRALPAAIAHAEAIGSDDPAVATRAFVQQLQKDPRNAYQLGNLAGLLADLDVDHACRDELRLLLLELALSLAPEDARLRNERDALRRPPVARDR